MSSPSPTTATESGQEGKQSKVIQHIREGAKEGVLYVLNIKFSSANDSKGSHIRKWFYSFIVNKGDPHRYKVNDFDVDIKWETRAAMQSSAYYLSKPTLDVESSVPDDTYREHTHKLIEAGLKEYSSENPDNCCGWTLDHLLTKTVESSTTMQQDDRTANNAIVPPTR